MSMSLERLSFKTFDFRPGRRQPELEQTDCVFASDHVSIGRENGEPEGRSLPFQREQLLLAFHVPEFDGLLAVAADREALAVWREGQRVDALQEAAESGDLFAAGPIPQLRKTEFASNGKERSVRRKGRTDGLLLFELRVEFATS